MMRSYSMVVLGALLGLAVLLAACTSGASEEDVDELRAEVSELRQDVDELRTALTTVATVESSQAPPVVATRAAIATPPPTAAPSPAFAFSCVLSIEDVRISRRAADFSDFADLGLTIMNSSDKPVRSWRLGIIFRDPFGNELFTQALRDGSADIPPGGTEDGIWEFEDNQFIADQPYDILTGFAPENLTLEIVEFCDVAFRE